MAQNSSFSIQFKSSRIVLAGMMGSGKSTVAKILADYLDWDFIDTDALIEKRHGKTIREIFADEGEPYFRNLERDLVKELQARNHCVIATGGGMIVPEENRNLLHRDSLFVHLHSSVQELMERLEKATNRPLLLRGELLEELQKIYCDRAGIYEGLPIQILTDDKTPVQIAWEILLQLVHSHEIISGGKAVVHVGLNLTSVLADILEQGIISTPVFILADEYFWPIAGKFYMERVLAEMDRSPNLHLMLISSSEQNKSIETATVMWQEMIEAGADRNSVLVVLGGGVPGDVGGFVASTLFRGIRLIQIPTTLLAQIDSSIGGKTGVNLQDTKNMVGTFYPAHHTLIDPLLLLTLPEREMSSGLAEMIKTALLGDYELFGFLEENMPKILHEQLPLLLRAVTRTAKIKVEIVEEDLYEKSGSRILLNLGHTYGHAIEVLSDYKLKHGEAVSLGMVLAAKLGVKLGYCDDAILNRLTTLLKQAQLPVKLPDMKKEEILGKIKRDKKRTNQVLRFVFPKEIGRANAVPLESEEKLLLAFDD